MEYTNWREAANFVLALLGLIATWPVMSALMIILVLSYLGESLSIALRFGWRVKWPGGAEFSAGGQPTAPLDAPELPEESEAEAAPSADVHATADNPMAQGAVAPPEDHAGGAHPNGAGMPPPLPDAAEARLRAAQDVIGELQQKLDATNDVVRFWHFAYLDYFLVAHTKAILRWLFEKGDWQDRDSIFAAFPSIGTDRERSSVLNALESNYLVSRAPPRPFEQYCISPHGRAYIERGPRNSYTLPPPEVVMPKFNPG